MNQNLYNPANPKNNNVFKTTGNHAGNSQISFSDVAKEITREMREASDSRVAALIEHTKNSLEEL